MSPGAGDAASATKSTFSHALHAVGKYLAPIAGVVAGYVAGPALGGARSIANAIWGVTGSGKGLSGTSANRLGGAVMAMVAAGLGAVFWSMRGGGMWHEIIGGLVGGFFFGAALFNAGLLVTGAQGPSGLIESLSSGVAEVAEGN
jgi:hypothetical protein